MEHDIPVTTRDGCNDKNEQAKALAQALSNTISDLENVRVWVGRDHVRCTIDGGSDDLVNIPDGFEIDYVHSVETSTYIGIKEP